MSSSRPCSSAARAWINVPEVSPASTMIVASASADIVWLRAGKNHRFCAGVCAAYRSTGTWLTTR